MSAPSVPLTAAPAALEMGGTATTLYGNGDFSSTAVEPEAMQAPESNEGCLTGCVRRTVAVVFPGEPPKPVEEPEVRRSSACTDGMGEQAKGPSMKAG